MFLNGNFVFDKCNFNLYNIFQECNSDILQDQPVLEKTISACITHLSLSTLIYT
jgi:hypothetical protein